MADDIEFLPPPTSSTDDLTFLPPPKKEGPGFVSTAKQLGAGVVESVPFYGEKLAQKTGVAEPKTLTERTARRTGRTLPYALAAAPFARSQSTKGGSSKVEVRTRSSKRSRTSKARCKGSLG